MVILQMMGLKIQLIGVLRATFSIVCLKNKTFYFIQWFKVVPGSELLRQIAAAPGRCKVLEALWAVLGGTTGVPKAVKGVYP